MSDMQQVIAGMTELNERKLATAARAAKAERQAQVTKHELMRSQARAKGKGKDVTVSPHQEQGIGASASKYQPQLFESEDDKW